MAKPCTLHPIPQAEQFFKIETANVGGRGGLPSRSFGGSRGPFSHVREWPPCLVQRLRRCFPAAPVPHSASHPREKESQLLYNLLTLCPFHFQMTCGILKIANCIGVSFLKHIFIINPAAGKKDSRQRVYTCLLYTSDAADE